MEILTFPITPFLVNTYVLKDGGEALVIDPGEGAPRVLRSLDGCAVRAVVNTHCHCDHCGGNAVLKDYTQADLLIHKDELSLLRATEMQGRMFGVPITPSPEPDGFLSEGDTVEVGGVSLSVILAPGHSPGHICFAGDGFIFAGDVLFAGSIGRTDLPGGSYPQLLESIRTKLLTLPDDTIVYTGHGPETTIGTERRTNPFLAGL